MISRVWVSIRKPQNGKPDLSIFMGNDLPFEDGGMTWAEVMMWSVKERRVLLGDINAPYLGKPAFITCTNRLAVIKSSVMNRKSSIYLNSL